MGRRRRRDGRRHARARATMEAMEADDVERGDGDGESAFDALSDGREWSLGFLERARDETTTRRERFPSKAGGAPAWLDPVRVPYDEELRAEDGETLDFLLQVYAPVDESRRRFTGRCTCSRARAAGRRTGREGVERFEGNCRERTRITRGIPCRRGCWGESCRGRRRTRGGRGVIGGMCRRGSARRRCGAGEGVSRVRVGGRDGGARRDGGVRGDEIREWDGREDMTADDVEEIEAEMVNKDMEQLAAFRHVEK